MRPEPRKSLKAALFAGASILAFGCGQASALTIMTTGCLDTNASCQMIELLAGGTIQVDDKLFDTWSSSDVPADFNNWFVTGTSDSGGIGLNFIGSSEQPLLGIQLIGGGQSGSKSLAFQYRVGVQNPTLEIVGNTLSLTSTFATGSEGAQATAQVQERLATTNAFDGDIGDKTVLDQFIGGDILTDTLPLTPARDEVFVETELSVTASTGSDGSASASVIRFATTYAQRVVSVPEPGSAALLGAGLAGLAGLRRRKKRV